MLATLRRRDFALLWSAGLISSTGNWVLITVLPFYLYERTGSTLASGLIWVSYSLPGLLLGSVAGVYVDRWDRKRTIVGANLLQAGLMLLLLPAREDGWLWLAYLVVFGEACIAQFSIPAENALLPRLVGEERLVYANPLNSLNDNLARIIGPPIGGALIAWYGFSSAAIADGASFLLAAGLVALIAAPASAGRGEATAESAERAAGSLVAVWREWRAGLGLVRGDPLLRGVFLVMGVSLFGDSILTALLVPFVRDLVGGGAEALGALFTIRGIAGLLGGAVVGWLGARLEPARFLGVSLMMLGALFPVVVHFPYMWVVATLWLLMGPFIIGWLTSSQTLLQMGAPDEYRGRVFGAYGMTSALTLLCGTGMASALGDVVGIVPLLDTTAALYCLAGVLALMLLPGRGAAQLKGQRPDVDREARTVG